MSKLFLEVLDDSRRKIFLDLKTLSANGVLAGGTSIALQLKHRKSYDFDIFLFPPSEVGSKLFDKTLSFYGAARVKLIFQSLDELSLSVDDEIKISFVKFPFAPLHPLVETETIPLLSLRDLASNKAYAIGRRPVFRDYVDLYFLFKNDVTDIKTVIEKSRQRFQGAFNSRLFLEQLKYVSDLTDFTVEFIGNPVDLKEISAYFSEITKSLLLTS